jgi:hypothetical protein
MSIIVRGAMGHMGLIGHMSPMCPICGIHRSRKRERLFTRSNTTVHSDCR